jgi:hypothetical protein
LFPEGTLSRVDAGIFSARSRKASKMRLLPPESLATALQLEKPSRSRQEEQDHQPDQRKFMNNE